MDEDFWKEIAVSPRELADINEESGNQLRLILESYPEEQSLFSEFFGIKTLDTGDSKALAKLAITEQGRTIIGLHKFQRSKIAHLKEYFHHCGEDSPEVLPQLLRWYSTDRSKVIDAAYYCWWNLIRLAEVWQIHPEIPAGDPERFFSSILGFRQRISRRLGKKARLARRIPVSGASCFVFELERTETLLQGYNERVPFLRRSAFGVLIDPTTNQITVRTSDNRITEILSTYYSGDGLTIRVFSPEKQNSSLERISKQILDYSGASIRIPTVKFNRLARGVDARTQFTHNTNVTEVISPLIEHGVIDPEDYSALDSFTVLSGAVRRKVVLHKDQSSVKFVLKREGLVQSKYEEIAQQLESKFGIILDADYPNKSSDQQKKNIMRGLVGKYLHQLSTIEEELYGQLKSAGVLQSDIATVLACPSCGATYSDKRRKKCGRCEAKLELLSAREKIVIDPDRVLAYVKNRLKSAFGKSVVYNSTTSTNRQLLVVRDTSSEIYFYPYYKGQIKTLLQKWEDEFIPSVRIVVGSGSAAHEDLALSTELYLYDVINQSDKELKDNVLSTVLRQREALLERSVSRSVELTEKILRGGHVLPGTNAEKGDAFESLCYPLIKYLFYDIVHWGKRQKFKSVPDGIYGIKMSSKKREAFSLIYDCKYSPNQVSFSSSEKRKARGYAKRANQADAVKAFSGKLTAFMILGHNIQDRRFEKLAEYIEGYRSWGGKIVLLQLEVLLGFYTALQAAMSQGDVQMKIAFNLAFSEVVRSTASRRVLLKPVHVDTVMKKAEDIRGSLDAESVLKHLESNIEY